MQIQKIQSNSPCFGYDPVVNAKLIQQLSETKKNKAFNTFVKDICLATNEAEMKLREAERKGQPYLMARLLNAFVPIKLLFIDIINNMFPLLKYRDEEIKSYEADLENVDELNKNNPKYWINAMITTLKAQRDQDKEEQMAAVMQAVMQEIFPDQNVQLISYGDKDSGTFISSENAEKIFNNSDEDEYKEDKLALGKSKVHEYVPTENSKKGFAALGGMEELKKTLNDRIVGMLKNPEQAKLDEKEYGKKMPKGILLYGPPGCGKTTIVEHLSTEAGVPLMELQTAQLGSPYIHEMSENIDAAFDYAESVATKNKPVLLFVDDAESMFSARTNANQKHDVEEMATFLNRVQRAGEHNVVVVAATNEFDLMDKAIKSRFEEQIYVGLPDKEARKSIIKLFLNQRSKGKALAQNEQKVDKLADMFDKFSIRDIKMITDKASIEALNDGRRDIALKDFDKIISQSENRKVKEENYKSNVERKPIGFTNKRGE